LHFRLNKKNQKEKKRQKTKTQKNVYKSFVDESLA